VKLDDIIGDVVFISFRNLDRIKEIGIQETTGHYKLKGYDHLGLWLEHPGVIIKHIEDKTGHPLPSGQQSEKKIDAIFLAHWDNVNTMMHYPNRKGFDFPDQVTKKIGFRFNEKKQDSLKK